MKRPLIGFAGYALIAVAVLAGLIILGQYTVTRLLARDAVRTAELWYVTASRESGGSLAELLRDGSNRAGWLLETVGIDAVVLASPDGTASTLGGVLADAVPDFRAAMDREASANGVGLFQLAPGAYPQDHLGWARGDYRNWVFFPAGADGTRIATRLQQGDKADDLVKAFRREVLFSGGVAVITFASFMAGFKYRARQLTAENAEIRYLALHDELTGLPNRKYFEDFMATALAGADTGRHKTALFVLDLDGFKAVNDTLGHPVGDGLLKAAAKRLKGSLRAGDLLARLSGDEFAIVVPQFTDPGMLAPMAERVLQMLSTPFRVDGHDVQVGCSIGLAVAPDNGSDTDRLMRNADFALYRAKNEGRRTWRFFDPKMAEDQASRRTLEDGLRHALENDLFQMFYQPQIDLASGRTVGYEAVLRWRLPGKGLVPASVFVSIAEETGLVIPIGEWAIRQIARDCALLPADRSVAINLSSTQLKRDGIEDFIIETLQARGVEPGRIEIEVNESILGRNEEVAFRRLSKIREAGLAIVMDSFGVGSLSLGLLSRYAFDKVKVDRTFLMQDEQKCSALLAAICGLGRSLGFRVAGQGIETSEHSELLRRAGCSEGQGYYFAAPMPLEAILRLDGAAAEAPALAAIA